MLLTLWRHAWRRFPLRYDPLYWSAVFPLGMYAASTFEMAHAMDLPFLAHDGAFVSEPLVIFLNLLSLWAFLQARSERRWGLPLGSFSLGLSVATRPNALLFLPFFVAWALRVGERPHGSMRRGVLVFAAVCALGLVPPGLVLA